jgi:hypothetical protein
MNGPVTEKKSWMPAFAGMTWDGQWVKTHVSCIIRASAATDSSAFAVIPGKLGIHSAGAWKKEIPAFAGMTNDGE